MSKYPSQTQDKFTVRFPDGMRDEIAKRAEENGRSMNSEIIQMLQFAMDNLPLGIMQASDEELEAFYGLNREDQINRIESINPEQAKIERFIDKQRDELFRFLTSQTGTFTKNK